MDKWFIRKELINKKNEEIKLLRAELKELKIIGHATHARIQVKRV